jgi:hypothetical protein
MGFNRRILHGNLVQRNKKRKSSARNIEKEENTRII